LARTSPVGDLVRNRARGGARWCYVGSTPLHRFEAGQALEDCDRARRIPCGERGQFKFVEALQSRAGCCTRGGALSGYRRCAVAVANKGSGHVVLRFIDPAIKYLNKGSAMPNRMPHSEKARNGRSTTKQFDFIINSAIHAVSKKCDQIAASISCNYFVAESIMMARRHGHRTSPPARYATPSIGRRHSARLYANPRAPLFGRHT
jgi:hypothetical protein